MATRTIRTALTSGSLRCLSGDADVFLYPFFCTPHLWLLSISPSNNMLEHPRSSPSQYCSNVFKSSVMSSTTSVPCKDTRGWALGANCVAEDGGGVLECSIITQHWSSCWTEQTSVGGVCEGDVTVYGDPRDGGNGGADCARCCWFAICLIVRKTCANCCNLSSSRLSLFTGFLQLSSPGEFNSW